MFLFQYMDHGECTILGIMFIHSMEITGIIGIIKLVIFLYILKYMIKNITNSYLINYLILILVLLIIIYFTSKLTCNL